MLKCVVYVLQVLAAPVPCTTVSGESSSELLPTVTMPHNHLNAKPGIIYMDGNKEHVDIPRQGSRNYIILPMVVHIWNSGSKKIFCQGAYAILINGLAVACSPEDLPVFHAIKMMRTARSVSDIGNFPR
jgi:hypothetical protein